MVTPRNDLSAEDTLAVIGLTNRLNQSQTETNQSQQPGMARQVQ